MNKLNVTFLSGHPLGEFYDLNSIFTSNKYIIVNLEYIF